MVNPKSINDLESLRTRIRSNRRDTASLFNDTDRFFESNIPVHELFWRWVARSPDATAARDGGSSVSYAELGKRAESLARHLVARGVRPGARVAIGMAPGVGRIVAVFGILRAGGAWLPLDLEAPDARLGYMLSDSQARCIVTDVASAPRMSAFGLDLFPVGGAFEGDVRLPAVSESWPAYVIYTSGSTGQPKGVVVSQASLVNRIVWMQRELAVTPADRIVSKTNFSFDVSIWEYLLPLASGAVTLIAPANANRDPALLCELFEKECATIAHFVPSLLDAFLDESTGPRCASLRIVIASGEALSVRLAERFAELVGCRLYNLYGPTEATIDVSFAVARPGAGGATVPIGLPVDNTRLYVMNDALELVAPGAEGELYIGGVQVALGYLNRSALTADRFVPDPFGPRKGARLYRTGDRVQRASDGSLVFLGRRDHQVKIRGHRIELQEIEAALHGDAGVQRAVVLAEERDTGDKELVAYVAEKVPSDTAERDWAEARRTLLAKVLPPYMVPSHFFRVSEFPATSNGKLDLKRLGQTVRQDQAIEVEPVLDGVESRLLVIWQNLLRTSSIGRTDDFFRSGGDSILAIRMAAQAHRAGIEFTVAELFEHPTLERLARVARVRAAEAPDAAVPLSAAQRAWLKSNERRPSGPLRARLSFDGVAPSRIEDVLKNLVADHDAFRMRLASNAVRLEDRTDRFYAVRQVDGPVDGDGGSALADCLDCESGPTIAASIARRTSGIDVELAVHPFALDPARISEVGAVLESLVSGERRGGPPRERSYARWCRDVGAHLRECPLPPASGVRATRREHPVDHAVSLHALCELALDLHASREELLLACLAAAIADVSGLAEVVALIERDGRPTDRFADFGGVLGRFVFPKALTVEVRSGSTLAALQSVKRGLCASASTDLENLDIPLVGLVSSRAATLEPFRDALPFFFDVDDSGEDLKLIVSASERGSALADPSRLADRVALRLSALATEVREPEGSPYVASEFPLCHLDDHAVERSLRQKRGVEDFYPTTPMQSGMLFRSLYWPESDAYFNQNVLELVGELDPDVLVEAWGAVAGRYEILRSGFVWDDLEEPYQYVLRTPPDVWRRDDWSSLPLERHADALAQMLKEDRREGLSVADFPLYRLRLIRRSDDRHYLLWSHHHILLDGWCLSLIWGDVFKAYETMVRGEFCAFPRVRPYRHFVAWLRKQDISGKAKAFWLDLLKGFDQPTRFCAKSTDEDAPFNTIPVELGAALTESVERTARGAGVTLNVVTQAIWSLLLSAHSGEDDVVHGVSVSGRPPQIDGVESMVGLFINTVPLRVRIDRGATIGALLRQVQRTLTLASEYAYVALAQIKAWSAAAGQHGGALFDSLVAFENYPEDNLPVRPMGGIEIVDTLAAEKTEYPLGLIALPGKSLILHFNYSTAHFDEGAIHRLSRHAIAMFERLAELGLDTEVRRIASVPDSDRFAVADGPECGLPDDPLDGWPMQQIFGFARRDPGATAIEHGDVSIDYRGLSARVAALAGELRIAGVRRGTAVVLALPMTPDYVVALLSVWAAGATAVPLDVDTPPERAGTVLRECDARVALTSASGTPRWVTPSVRVMHPSALEAADPRLAPRLPLTGADVACIFYTSGSTERPKGVMCTFAGLRNRLEWSLGVIEHQDRLIRLLATAGCGFDISLWEILCPLVSRGTLVLSDAAQGDADGIAELLVRRSIDVVHFVPSVLEKFVDSGRAASCRMLRYVVCGGEALTAQLARRFFALGLRAELHHAYGPTEASISVTHWNCPPGSDAEEIPIGFPISRTLVHLLNADGAPVPTGAIGQLCIGGVSLAHGYLGDAARTAERFVPDPFSSVPGSRMYLTGDLARRLPNGSFRFVGRNDDQVKLRGHRIEPDEVRAAIEDHPAVRSAAVLALPAPSGEPQLVAFVTSTVRELNRATLLPHIERRLPSWMIPGAVLVIDEIPLMANGKVDRRRLAAQWNGKNDRNQAEREPPKTALEAIVARAFAESLGLSQLGRDDNFFELGGHSLMMIQIVNRLKRDLPGGLSCDITEIFKAPTPAALATRILGQTAGWGASPLVSYNPSGSGVPIFLIHPGEGIASAYRWLAGLLQEHPVHAVSNPRFGDREQPFRSVGGMSDVYLGYVVEALGGRAHCIVGGWSFGGVVALELASRLARRGVTVDAVLMFDTHDLSRLPQEPIDTIALEEGLRRRGVDPQSPEGKAFLFEIVNNGELARAHRPQPFARRVLLFEATERRGVLLDCGWSKDVLTGLETFAVPGTHETLFDPENVGGLASAVRAHLVGQRR